MLTLIEGGDERQGSETIQTLDSRLESYIEDTRPKKGAYAFRSTHLQVRKFPEENKRQDETQESRGVWVVRVGEDDGTLRLWHCIHEGRRG